MFRGPGAKIKYPLVNFVKVERQMNFPTYQLNFIGSKSGKEASEPSSGALGSSSEAPEPVSEAPEASLEAPETISKASVASLEVLKPS